MKRLLVLGSGFLVLAGCAATVVRTTATSTYWAVSPSGQIEQVTVLPAHYVRSWDGNRWVYAPQTHWVSRGCVVTSGTIQGTYYRDYYHCNQPVPLPPPPPVVDASPPPVAAVPAPASYWLIDAQTEELYESTTLPPGYVEVWYENRWVFALPIYLQARGFVLTAGTDPYHPRYYMYRGGLTPPPLYRRIRVAPAYAAPRYQPAPTAPAIYVAPPPAAPGTYRSPSPGGVYVPPPAPSVQSRRTPLSGAPPRFYAPIRRR